MKNKRDTFTKNTRHCYKIVEYLHNFFLVEHVMEKSLTNEPEND